MRGFRMRGRWSLLCLGAAVTASGALAGDAPDLELNPATGFVESVDVAEDAGFRIRHVVDRGQGGSKTISLVSSGAGNDPRIAIKPTGKSWAVWWRSNPTGEVLFSVRNLGSGGWDTETLASLVGEDSRNPEVLHQGSAAWIAYEIAGAGGGTSIGALAILDDPEPIPTRTLVASTTWSGVVDLLVHAEAGKVWLTWVDSGSYVGWSQYDSATAVWSLPQYESYATVTVEQARMNIRTAALGL